MLRKKLRNRGTVLHKTGQAMEETCKRHRYGCISDTHGLFRPEIVPIFEGVERIFHCGDIGKPAILRELEKIAPVTAVLGNTDVPSWYPEVRKTEFFELHGTRILMIHDLDELETAPDPEKVRVVLYGHSHKPAARKRGGVWYINPGSAGPHRFMLPVSLAILQIGDEISVRHHTIRTHASK